MNASALSALLSALETTVNGAQKSSFAARYLQHVPQNELALFALENLQCSLEDTFDFFSHAPHLIETPLVRVFNSSHTPHTTLEVLCADQPFLVDSLWGEMHRRGLEVHHTLHPVFTVQRDANGTLQALQTEQTPDTEAAWHRESLIHIEFDRQPEEAVLRDIQQSVEDVLLHAKHVVEHFPVMMEKLADVTRTLNTPDAQTAEECAFLDWLKNDHFIFLGYRHYDVIRQNTGDTLFALTRGSGLGILSNDADSSVYNARPLHELEQNISRYMTDKTPLTITKALTKAPVHRYADMDYIGVKEFNAAGDVVGEHRFLGLFTSKAYTLNPMDIPLIRRKIADVVAMETHLGEQSHNMRALINTLETYPRDELFQINPHDLHRIATGILHLKERQQVRLFIRQSHDERLVTAMVFIPRDRMSGALRAAITQELMTAYHGENVEFLTTLGDSLLARLFLKIRIKHGAMPRVDEHAMEAKLADLARDWEADLKTALYAFAGETEGRKQAARFKDAFKEGYKENTPTTVAVQDVQNFTHLLEGDSAFLVDVQRYAYLHETTQNIHLKVYHKGQRLTLSALIPLFDRAGLTVAEEYPSQVSLCADDVCYAQTPLWLHDFILTPSANQDRLLTGEADDVLKEMFERIHRDVFENDTLNGLVLTAGLSLSQVTVLRALAAYMQQASGRFTKETVRAAFVKHAVPSRLLAELFEARFDLSHTQATSDKLQADLSAAIDHELNTVSALEEDTILRHAKGIILAMVRTNAWQRADVSEPLAFKLNSSLVPELRKPHPLCEIFVYHYTVEGIHLRGGKVARGGLRWSDRPTDFRTEVLGLVKAQMTKNAVIVPTGSKGGFVPKNLPADPAAKAAAGQAAYRTFINSLLCLTDNIVGGQVVPPVRVKRYDENDPYLVVAADKGTATFSDIANGLAQNAAFWGEAVRGGFWLGDAFASGGSNGYDHKKMGITAKGAWECVKHHFRKLGKNIQAEDFTVVGIGDMGGDVFGNGMLLSQHIRLLAAFNHLHIFVDPTPDAATSWAERNRLFQAVKGWGDYDRALISKGGGVFNRSDKEIPLSPEMKAWLGTDAASLTPDALIKALLQLPVDLFWNGGIGTYVKSPAETHADVGDRANDAIRLDASELKAKVVGEGGNLGFTQLGRIAYAQTGGLLNTDAIDNSAGVDCSDHEVNIKILLGRVAETHAMGLDERNALLADMTDEVGKLVLKDNYLQAQALTLLEEESTQKLDDQIAVMLRLQKEGQLDAPVEFLPNAEEISARKAHGKGLTRPELSVLMAYVKMDLFNRLLKTDLPDDAAFTPLLTGYFPARLREAYAPEMAAHPLKREIIATVMSNELVNRMGLTFADRMAARGCTLEALYRGFYTAVAVHDVAATWAGLEAPDEVMEVAAQLEQLRAIQADLEKAVQQTCCD